ncbi:MAG: PaaX family transcriptional regulator C-terminal domain-containing protein [Aquihabitans sp.]
MSVPGQHRSLTARSVIASTLLGVSPPELSTRSLVVTAELLGIATGTARVALSRMVAAGELEPVGDSYRLVGPNLLARQTRQVRSRDGSVGTWDGTWRTFVVVGDARPAAERSELRAAMAMLRTAELREGVWLRPDNLASHPTRGPETIVDRQCLTFAATPDSPTDLAARLWDLGAWSTKARDLRREMAKLNGPLQLGDPSALAPGFVLSAAVLRHFQADPLLPAELLPARWPGADLRVRYEAFDTAFRATLADWQRAHSAATAAP